MNLSFQKIRGNTRKSWKLHKNENIFEIVDRKPWISADSRLRLKSTFLKNWLGWEAHSAFTVQKRSLLLCLPNFKQQLF